MRDVLERVQEFADRTEPVVVCSVVNTRGSTPQKPGAMMVVLPAGGQIGTLGGGCVEAEVRREALRLLSAADSDHALLSFHLDNDYGWDDGLICGGRMYVLAERVDAAEKAEYFAAMFELARLGRGFTEAVCLAERGGAAAGARVLFDAEGGLRAALRVDGNALDLRARLRPLAERPRPYEAEGWAFSPHWPRCRLIIAGAGHVGKALARYAAEADFEVWVIDDRADYASRERFPHAERLIVGDIGAELRKVPCDEHTCVVIVTRGHNHDEEALHAVVDRPFGFIGMIGSRRKVRLIFEDLAALGVAPELLQRVRAPIGLNIASRTVPEIAVSILAELIAFRNGADLPEEAFLHARGMPTRRFAQPACRG